MGPRPGNQGIDIPSQFEINAFHEDSPLSLALNPFNRVRSRAMKQKFTTIQFLAYTALLVGGLLSGCASSGSDESSEPTGTDAGTVMTDASQSPQSDAEMSGPRPGDATVPTPTDGTTPAPDAGAQGNYLREIPGTLAPAMGDALCGYLDRCEYKALLEALINEPCAQFITRQFNDATVARLQSAVSEGVIGFDPAGAQACLTAFDDLECSPDFDSLAMACLSGFVGLIPNGEPCTLHEACVSGHYCDTSEGCAGTCAPLAAVDEACNDPAACSGGASCIQGTCQLPAPLGESCGGGGVGCEVGLYCDGANGARGRCRTFNSNLARRDRSCDINGGPLCEEDLACVTVLNEVIPIPEFRCRPKVGEGEECFPGFPEHCEAGLYCAGTNIMSFPPDLDGVCRPIPGVDEPCGQAPAFEVCGPELVCDEGTCRPRSELGDACRVDTTCYSGRCTDQVCVTNDLCVP